MCPQENQQLRTGLIPLVQENLLTKLAVKSPRLRRNATVQKALKFLAIKARKEMAEVAKEAGISLVKRAPWKRKRSRQN